MSRRHFRQLSLGDSSVKVFSRAGALLGEIARTFERAAFDVLMRLLPSSLHGVPACPPRNMLKIVPLQQWSALSDPGVEYAARNRLSFRRFCSIPLGD